MTGPLATALTGPLATASNGPLAAASNGPLAAVGLLTALVDDAGLFPPTALPMADALARHRADQAGGDLMLTHRFLCPASRIGELRAELADTDHVRVGLIADTDIPEALAQIAADARLELALVEVPGGPGDIPDVAVPVFVEPPDWAAWGERSDAGPRIVGELADRGAGLKIRCGGVSAHLFPTPLEVALSLVAAAHAGIPVKATAGLHHAVRHRDPDTGFTHHGYLNLVVAAAHAAAGAPVGEVAEVLGETDPATLVALARELGDPTPRPLLFSYGSCSTSTPLIEARDLGLTEKGIRR